MVDVAATLVLSGGGAKGAFQIGAERVLREEYGFRWERIFGVSVGALNAALMAQHEYARLRELWLTIREQDVYRKFPWPIVALRVGLLHKLGLYDGKPLRQLIEKHAAGRPFLIPAHVGRVSLQSGEYELVPSTDPDFLDAVWQSATMPVIWEAIGPQSFVDGGLRNVTPLGDALEHSTNEIVVIACSGPKIEAVKAPTSLLDVAKRSLTDITINEILLNDVQEFIRINDLVRQGHEAGLELKKQNGKPYRYCPITVIEPVNLMGDTLDFSQESIQRRMRHGEEVARATLRIGRENPVLGAPVPPGGMEPMPPLHS